MTTHFRRQSRWTRSLVGLCSAMFLPGCNVRAQQACRQQVLQGEVQAGQAWQQTIAPDLVLKLEAVPAGWMIRVLSPSRPRPLHDAAELANPPYRSPTPILLSTDFAFRAQDAIAWNPRTFRFFTTPEQTAEAERIYQETLLHPNDSAAAGALATLLGTTPEATLTIRDAVIVNGTADQSAAAATVALHFEQTAHSVRTDFSPSPLGRLLALRFRIVVPPFGAGCRSERLR